LPAARIQGDTGQLYGGGGVGDLTGSYEADSGSMDDLLSSMGDDEELWRRKMARRTSMQRRITSSSSW